MWTRFIGLWSIAFAVASAASPAHAADADLIVHNAKITTLDASRPHASALAVHNGTIVAVGSIDEVLRHRGKDTDVIDAYGRRLIPGLNDSHMHPTRGGRFFHLELRWDGVDSLARGLSMVAEQAKRTPDGQWVRVIGGWTPYQFAERRMPTIAELNRAAPDTPTFVLFLYSQGFLNRAGLEALGITEDTPAPPGSRYEFIDGGAILHAEPNPTILYKTIGKLPHMTDAQQLNSTLYFYRDLNRFGLTSAIDAGGGGHQFPDHYGATQSLAANGGMPLRISYYLFPQRPGKELEDFQNWTDRNRAGRNADSHHDHGFELEGGGEFLVWSAGDFENFMADRPELDSRGDWRTQLRDVAGHLVDQGWPLRIHATYDQSMRRILEVFEGIEKDKGKFAPRWAFDHAETASVETLKRVKALGGGVAIQNRMAFAGEYFVERYGFAAARHAPPIREMRALGIPVGAGTDATRVSSYNPWLSIYWLVTGKTVGGTPLTDEEHQLSRLEALELFTVGSAWFSQEEEVKGRLAPGQLADFAILNEDFLEVPEESLRDIEAVLTVMDGQVRYGAGPYRNLNPELPPVDPAWSPVSIFGGYQR